MSLVLSDLPLERLLALAGIGQWSRHQWFQTCRLEKTVILCPDRKLLDSLVRCWLPQIEDVFPDVTMRYEPQTSPAKAFTGEPPASGRLDGL